MTILDSVLILFLLCGAVLGFKNGTIKSLVALVGTIVVVIVSYYLKNPVADILFKFAPFFKFGGSWEGLITLNILLYEGISYLLVFLILFSVLSILLKVSGIIEKILTMTIILGIPSKIIGAVLGLLEAVVFSFIILFSLLQFNFSHEMVQKSSLSRSILDKTPVIGTMINDTYNGILEIEQLHSKHKDDVNKDEYNSEILDIMLNKGIVTVDVTKRLIEDKKLDFNGAKEVLDKYNKD